ncbi:MAG: MTAP family purine nucleoside phosphorylase [Verrucomicrobia bacterium]|nr:MTAP family purine nucleoside phosphorylase [Verrucomicrobiota bacterium]MCH8513904.1 MTAP family purine nucleoside phosphorylase [Kiritimatiellia bacterium]
MIAYLTGSGFYDLPEFEPIERETRFGTAWLLRGKVNGVETLLLPRHGPQHRYLPHQINHRANLLALKEAGATAVVSCSVCGILNPDWPLATPLLATDLYFPENRLGDGQCCTVFDRPGEPGRGHLLAGSLFHTKLSQAVRAAMDGHDPQTQSGTYAHVSGPRFNTVSEIKALRTAGVDFLSQTCGPEAVLANELELPYALAAFGIDYANGVQNMPTPIEVLNNNLAAAKETFVRLIQTLREPTEGFTFENFVYRFE